MTSLVVPGDEHDTGTDNGDPYRIQRHSLFWNVLRKRDKGTAFTVQDAICSSKDRQKTRSTREEKRNAKYMRTYSDGTGSNAGRNEAKRRGKRRRPGPPPMTSEAEVMNLFEEEVVLTESEMEEMLKEKRRQQAAAQRSRKKKQEAALANPNGTNVQRLNWCFKVLLPYQGHNPPPPTSSMHLALQMMTELANEKSCIGLMIKVCRRVRRLKR